MTSNYSGDDFFNSDNEDHGPNLIGEYTRGNTPPSKNNYIKPTGNPSAGSSTSGHFSSDSANLKTRGTMSDYDSRSRSRTPSGSTYRYSDSFDSEASGDSRSSSPRSRKGRGGGKKKKSGGDSARRFDSGTSRDSRSTFRSTANSSIYGRPTKKSTNKSPPKKGRGRGSVSNSAQSTPRGGNLNETTRRMLSAKGHTISRLRNEYDVLRHKHEELDREFKLQKQLHRKNERELDKYTKQEDSLPIVMKAQNNELEHYRKKCQSYRDKDRQKDHQLKQYNDKLNRTQDELKRARSILEDKGLKERADLQKERDALEQKVQEKESKLEDIERYIKNVKKNQRHERRDWKNNEKEFKGQIEQLEVENERLQLQLREKEKELEIKNIYSNRIVKPPGRLLAQSLTPNTLRPTMIHKSTTTDDIQLNKSPRQPQAPRKATSDDALESRIKSPRDERLRQKAEEQRQKSRERTEEKKELSESDRILMALDAGIVKKEEKKPSPPPPPAPEEDDETARILRQFDDHSLVKNNSEKKKAEEDRRKEEERKLQEKKRREEEERRRKEEEEERKRKEEEQRKPQWLKGSSTTTTSSSTSNSSGYTPSFSKPGIVRPSPGASTTSQSNQQHKVTASKLPWFSSDPPVRKTEQERREKEEQDNKLTNGITDSPRRSPNLNPPDDDEEENFPFFGSKPAPAKPANQTFAVNSIKDIQKMSAARENSSSGKKDSDDVLDGFFAKSAVKDEAKNDKEIAEQQAKAEEERRKKELLLARMRDIDDGKKPSSGRSQKQYNHSDPVKNMHQGLPSHPDVSQKNHRKSIDSDELTFGSYAPTFSSSNAKPAAKGPAKKKNPFFDNDPQDDDSDSGFKLSPKHSPQRLAKKTNLMSDLFGNESEKSDNPSRSSFGDDNVFSSSTKAKPVADTGAYPWEKKVAVGQGGVKQNGGIGGGQKAAPVSSFSDNFDDDLEELTL